ncbi:MAG: CehA/McbA family metallohydrolase [Gemmataceae bacterium]
MNGFQNVHIRVNDKSTGKPTPVRIRFLGPGGESEAPFGRVRYLGEHTRHELQAEGNVLLPDPRQGVYGTKAFAYIDGTCEIELPVGQLEVEIDKGPEYVPLVTTANLPQGKLAMRFEIERWTNFREKRWYSGDTHCYDISPHGALLEGGGEDLAVVNLLAREEHQGESFHIPNMLAFSGQRPCVSNEDYMVVVNTRNESELGCLALLNCHRPVFPLNFEDRNGLHLWNVADWCEQCHRKRGLVVALEFFNQVLRLQGNIEAPFPDAGELLADAILGHIDTIDLDGGASDAMWPWLDLLSAGFRIPLSGGSGKCSVEQRLGDVRTYAQLLPGEDFDYKNWIEAVRAGRTFVTNGPLLTLTVDGCVPGEVLDVTESRRVAIECQAEGLVSFDKLQVFWNHELIGNVTVTEDGLIYRATWNEEFPIDQPGFFYARCTGGQGNVVEPGFAHTSPIYVQMQGNVWKPNVDAVDRLRNFVDLSLCWVRENGKFETEQQYERMAAIYQAAQAVLDERRKQG